MANYKLKVKLGLKWLEKSTYEATVTVTTTDSCFHAGELTIGLPPGEVGIPETEYLTFAFTHTGEICSDIVRDVTKSIKITSSAGKTNVTAFATVDGKVAGQDTKPFPRG
jgi:hypothetical protein